MKTKPLFLLAAFLILAVFLQSCAGLGLPHQGAFLREGEQTREINVQWGSFNLDTSSEILDTSCSSPLVLLWNRELEKDQLALVDRSHERRVEFNLKKRLDGVYEIQPVQPLERGVYCLVSGTPLKSTGRVASWCFAVNGGLEEAVEFARQTSEAKYATQAAAVSATEVAAMNNQLATAEARAQSSIFWLGAEGTQLYELAGKTGEILQNAFPSGKSTALSDGFSPNAVLVSDPMPRQAADLMRCTGPDGNPELVFNDIFTGGTLERFDESAFERETFERIFDVNHVALKATLHPEHQYTLTCARNNKKKLIEVKPVPQSIKACFYFVHTNKGWMIEQMDLTNTCSLQFKPDIELPEELR